MTARSVDELAAEKALADLLQRILMEFNRLSKEDRIRLWYTVAEFYEIPYKAAQ